MRNLALRSIVPPARLAPSSARTDQGTAAECIGSEKFSLRSRALMISTLAVGAWGLVVLVGLGVIELARL